MRRLASIASGRRGKWIVIGVWIVVFAALMPLGSKLSDYTVLTVPTNFDEAADWGQNVRDLTGDDANGMQIVLSGDLGFSTDSEEIFADLDATLLLATVALVLVLLGAVYRPHDHGSRRGGADRRPDLVAIDGRARRWAAGADGRGPGARAGARLLDGRLHQRTSRMPSYKAQRGTLASGGPRGR